MGSTFAGFVGYAGFAVGRADEMLLSHVPVLLDEVVRGLDPQPGDVILDCTVGSGGHAAALLSAGGGTCTLVGLDRDPEALERAGRQLAPFGRNAWLVRTNFARLETALDRLGLEKVQRVLFDLGVSSPQFDDPERGFSYRADAPLDMRMDPEETTSAYHLVNGLTEEELTRVIREYGEERWAPRIARAIVRAREKEPVVTTGQLAAIVKAAVPAATRRRGPHPARRTFQALRIAVNRELDSLAAGLDAALRRLAPGGRLAIISFHSLEDRIVKHRLREWERGCVCPPGSPVCVCGKESQVKVLTRRPIVAGGAEVAANPRARSAKLRVAERLPAGGTGVPPAPVLGPARGEYRG